MFTLHMDFVMAAGNECLLLLEFNTANDDDWVDAYGAYMAGGEL